MQEDGAPSAPLIPTPAHLPTPAAPVALALWQRGLRQLWEVQQQEQQQDQLAPVPPPSRPTTLHRPAPLPRPTLLRPPLRPSLVAEAAAGLATSGAPSPLPPCSAPAPCPAPPCSAPSPLRPSLVSEAAAG